MTDDQTTLAERQQAALAEATPYLLFDAADDAAILSRIKGEAIDVYTYSFTMDGRTIYGLSVEGAEACKRELARGGEVIEEESFDVIFQDAEEAWFSAKASRWSVTPEGQRV